MMWKRAALWAILGTVLAGCGPSSGGPGINWEGLKEQIKLEGDLQCKGHGTLDLFGFVTVGAKGTAGVSGDMTATLDGKGAACAGLQLFLGPFKYTIVAATQDRAECQDIAGKIVVGLGQVEAGHETSAPAQAPPEEELAPPAPGETPEPETPQ